VVWLLRHIMPGCVSGFGEEPAQVVPWAAVRLDKRSLILVKQSWSISDCFVVASMLWLTLVTGSFRVSGSRAPYGLDWIG